VRLKLSITNKSFYCIPRLSLHDLQLYLTIINSCNKSLFGNVSDQKDVSANG